MCIYFFPWSVCIYIHIYIYIYIYRNMMKYGDFLSHGGTP